MKTATAIHTTTLNDGTTVLAKHDPKYGWGAYTFTNRKQAERRLIDDVISAGHVGCVIQPRLSRVFYVAVEECDVYTNGYESCLCGVCWENEPEIIGRWTQVREGKALLGECFLCGRTAHSREVR